MLFSRPHFAPLATLLLAAALLPPAESAGRSLEERFVYFPERELIATPADFGLDAREVWFFAPDGVRLHGWYLPGDSTAPLLLFCHGNAGNISHRLENLVLLHRLGLNVFIFDYRGYGRSEGTPGEEGTYNDGRGALAWLGENGWAPGRMVYFGRSLGAGVALQLALETPPAALVLESPFPSIAALGWHHSPLLYLLLGWALDARYDNLKKIGELRRPLMIFQGTDDDIVTEKMARRLFDRASPPKKYHPIPGAGHNDTYEIGGAPYWEAWRSFLRDHTP